MKRIRKKGFVLMALVLSTWLLSGVYFGREFREPYLFLKHRSTFKFIFCSPLGEADRSDESGKEGYLTKGQEKRKLFMLNLLKHIKVINAVYF